MFWRLNTHVFITCQNKQIQTLQTLNPCKKHSFSIINEEEHCKSHKRPNFTLTINENQTLNAKTFYIPATTKNRTPKTLPFP